jgi:ZIP family zinc transporter
MAAAFGWGTLAASSLVIGALVALWFRISLRVIGLILAFGAGVLISAVAFDLVEEAVSKAHGHGAAIAGSFAGCAVFFGGDWLIDHFGGLTVRTLTAARRAAPRWPSCSGRCSTGSPSRW